MAKCPDGYFADSISGYCEACPPGCLICYGPSYDKCTICGPNPNNASDIYYKMIMLNSCVNNCPDGQY